MKITIRDFDSALLYAYGADLWARGYYWSNLIKVYRSLQKEDISQTTPLLNRFIEKLNIEEKIKFFSIAETVK